MKLHVAIIESSKRKDYLINLILKYCPYVEINWSFNSTKDFINTSYDVLPELIFIDPTDTCLEELEIIKRRNLGFEFIVLAQKEKPRCAPLNFFNPSGYLFYPLDEELLILAIENARRILAFKKTTQNRSSFSDQVGIPSSDGIDFISRNEIIRCESLTNCTRIVTLSSHKNIISSYNIGEFKKLLAEPDFFCPHKSHLINLSLIFKYKREGYILMKGDERAVIPVSRNKRSEFMNLVTRL